MRRRLLLVIGIVAVALSASGCWDRREINDVAFVVATAFDKEEESIRVTVQIPLPGQLGGIGGRGGGGGTSGRKPWIVDSYSGSTIREVNAKQQLSLSRQINFAHRRVILFGEDLARDGIGTMVDALARMPQNRLTAFVAVTRGMARDALAVEAPIEQFPAEMMRELAQSSMRTPRNLRQLLNAMMAEGIDPLLPVFEVVSNSPGPTLESSTLIRLGGIALFRQDQLAGMLDTDTATGLLWAMGQISSPTEMIPSPSGKGSLVVRFAQVDADYTPYFSGSKLAMRIHVLGVGNLSENPSHLPLSDGEQLDALEHEAERTIRSKILRSLEVVRSEYGVDPLGLGQEIYRQMPREWAKVRSRWREVYAKMPITVDVDLHLEHTGAFTMPLGLPRSQVNQ